VEIIKLLPVDHAAHKLPIVQMLAGPQAHGQDIVLRHPIDQLLADIRPVLLLLLRLRRHVPVRELPHRLLQPSVALLVVRTLELRPQPQRFRVRDGAQVAGLALDDFGRLALHDADAQLVLVPVEDLLSVQVVEFRRGVLTRDLGEHDAAAGMRVDEVGEVVDAVVDDAPERVWSVVFRDFCASEGLMGHWDGFQGLELNLVKKEAVI